MNIIKYIKIADLLTIFNLCCGVLSVFASIRKSFFVSAIFILAAVLFDFLDGKVAKKLGQTNAFGRELDSLSDLVSFGVAPAILFYVQSSRSLVVAVVLLFFVSCGMLRLARFNLTKLKGFEGVPITVNGIIFPVLQFTSLLTVVWLFVFALMGFLMVSGIPIKKVF